MATGQEAMDTNYNTGNSDFLVGNILTMKVFKYYSMLPRDVVQSSSLEVVKTELGTALRNLIQLDLH